MGIIAWSVIAKLQTGLFNFTIKIQLGQIQARDGVIATNILHQNEQIQANELRTFSSG